MLELCKLSRVRQSQYTDMQSHWLLRDIISMTNTHLTNTQSDRLRNSIVAKASPSVIVGSVAEFESDATTNGLTLLTVKNALMLLEKSGFDIKTDPRAKELVQEALAVFSI